MNQESTVRESSRIVPTLLIGIALIWFSDTALYLFRVTSTRAATILFFAGFEIGIGIKYIQLPFIWDIKFFEYIVLS